MILKRLSIVLILVASTLAPGQDPPPPLEHSPLFIKATIYPTFSLSRYDYNLDQNRRELRVYIELREKGIQGERVGNARVQVNGIPIEFDTRKKDYRKRIHLQHQDHFSRNILLEIKGAGGSHISEKLVFPGWVKITRPMPEILNPDRGIEIHWTFTAHEFPLMLHIDDFKNQRPLLREHREPEETGLLDKEDVPEDSVLRIWVTADWFQKKYLRGPDVVRGSEINIMPWSQVFVRTRPLETAVK